MPRPDSSEYAPAYENYILLVPDLDIVNTLSTGMTESQSFLGKVSESDACRVHAPYTWTIKQVVGHLIDSERVFGYRALRFARGDATPLPGFDENAYAKTAVLDRVSLGDLALEFEALRRSHVLFFTSLTDADWARRGTANQVGVSVRALAYIIAGHERHHMAIVRKRLA
jgi:DinB superfamily